MRPRSLRLLGLLAGYGLGRLLGDVTSAAALWSYERAERRRAIELLRAYAESMSAMASIDTAPRDTPKRRRGWRSVRL